MAASNLPDNVEMDQSTAQVLFREGAILVFLDVPEGTEFGIDYNCWRVGSKFKGVKMIPPGIHFVYYSASNSHNQTAPRTGFFHEFGSKEIVVKKWDPLMEDISNSPVSDEELQRYESNKEELDKFLGVYPYDSYKKWVSLTNHITPVLLQKLQPLSGKICAVTQFSSPASTTKDRKEAKEKQEAAMDSNQVAENAHTDSDGLPEMVVVPGTEIRFSKIPKQKWPEDASAQDITKYSMDHSYVLQNLLKSEFYADDKLALLGEIQFAFVCFLIGQVYDGFDQWKQLVHLLCSSDEAVSHNVHLYDAFITTLHFHIKEIPEDFFVDIVSRNNFLTTTLQTFFSLMADITSTANDIKNLREKAEKFKNHLEKKFDWDFTTEDDEFAPVVVTL